MSQPSFFLRLNNHIWFLASINMSNLKALRAVTISGTLSLRGRSPAMRSVNLFTQKRGRRHVNVANTSVGCSNPAVGLNFTRTWHRHVLIRAIFTRKKHLAFSSLRPNFYPHRLWHFQKISQFLPAPGIRSLGEYSRVLVLSYFKVTRPKIDVWNGPWQARTSWQSSDHTVTVQSTLICQEIGMLGPGFRAHSHSSHTSQALADKPLQLGLTLR